METLKSFFISLVVVAGFTGALFWAFTTIESGTLHINNQEKVSLENKNKELQSEISELKNKIEEVEVDNSTDAKITEEIVVPVVETKPVEQKPVVTTPKPVVHKYQTLIDELQKIYNDRVYMKKGSVGVKVGTIQKFINIYNKTDIKVDNDYGSILVTAISKFQKDQGLSVDGGVGPSTVLKMIEWLKKQ